MKNCTEQNCCCNVEKVCLPLPLRPKYRAMPYNMKYSDSDYNSLSDSSNHRFNDKIREVAGFKLFSAVILNSWRICKKEMDRLLQTLEDLKQYNRETKEKLDLYNQLLRIEQQRNDKLGYQLKNSIHSLNKVRMSYKDVKSKWIKVKVDKTLTEQELKVKQEEYDALNDVLVQTKTDLFRCMVDKRNLQKEVCTEQRTVQALKLQKKEILYGIFLLNYAAQNMEKNYTKIINEKDREIINAKNDVFFLKSELDNLREKFSRMEMVAKINESLSVQVEYLRGQIEELKRQNGIGFSNKLNLFYQQLIVCNKMALQFFHVFCYYIMPATPAPPTFR